MASRPGRAHAAPMMEFLLLVLTGVACLALLAAVPLGYLESRSADRERRSDR